MSSPEFQLEIAGDDLIVHRRVFDAPPASVFDALTQPELLRLWYGPPGWTCTECAIDLRVGGPWRIVTRKPDGREIIQAGEFLEITAPWRFVKTERWADWDVGEVIVTTELGAQNGATLLVVTTRFPSKAIRDQLLASGAARHAREHYDKLAALVAPSGSI
jgi:uncharacterized protein YndB with AHSA1/START domain